MNQQEEAIQALEKLRPYLQRDGGDVHFVRLEDDILHIELAGLCLGCPAITLTLQAIEEFLTSELPFITKVVLDNAFDPEL